MGREMAAKLVRRLLAGYPNLTAADPEAYLTALIEVMQGYPVWAGERAITRVDPENKDFPPSDKRLRSWLDEYVRPVVFANQYAQQSAEQLAEREWLERQSKETSPEGRTAIADRFKDALRAGGLKFDGDAPEQASIDADRERLMKMGNLSREQFDQIPAAPNRGDYWHGVRWRRA
jgi:hypothetical protein